MSLTLTLAPVNRKYVSFVFISLLSQVLLIREQIHFDTSKTIHIIFRNTNSVLAFPREGYSLGVFLNLLKQKQRASVGSIVFARIYLS